MKLLDTGVVIYAIGREHPYREPCRAIISQLEELPHQFTINAEMLQEVLDVFSNKRAIETGIDALTNLLALFPDPIPITGADIGLASRLIGQTAGISVRDAVHAATVIGHGLEGIVSTDRDLDRIPGLRRFDPAELAADP